MRGNNSIRMRLAVTLPIVCWSNATYLFSLNDLFPFYVSFTKKSLFIKHIYWTKVSFQDVLLLISTNQRLIQLKINNCAQFSNRYKCLGMAPNICGWDNISMKCTSLNGRIDLNRWERSACQKGTYDARWSQPRICDITDSQLSLKCICKYCIDESLCKDQTKVQITNCSGFSHYIFVILILGEIKYCHRSVT